MTAPAPPDNPFRPVDDDMLQLAVRLIREGRHAVLGVADPADEAPHLSRIALQTEIDGTPLALLSALATHSSLLRQAGAAGLLIAAEGGRGDALAQPRLSLQVTARAQPVGDDAHRARLRRWVEHHPKARVYAELPDFRFWRLEPRAGLLNAGFGRACRLSAGDLAQALDLVHARTPPARPAG